MQKYLKAIVAAVVAGLGALSAAYAVGPVNVQGYIAVATAVLVSLGAVWAVPNTSAKETPNV